MMLVCRDYKTYLLIMRKLAPGSTITFTSLKSTAHAPSLPLLPLCLFVFFFFLFIVAHMINPYNSPKNLCTIQIICRKKSKTGWALQLCNYKKANRKQYLMIMNILTYCKICTSLILICNKGETLGFSRPLVSNKIHINNLSISIKLPIKKWFSSHKSRVNDELRNRIGWKKIPFHNHQIFQFP